MRRRTTSNEPSKRPRRAESAAKKGRNRPDPNGQETRKPHLDLAAARRAVLKRGWLAEQDKEFQAAILGRATLQHFSAASPVFNAGDYRGGIYGVAEGSFGISVPQSGGGERLAHVVHAGVWFGYDPLRSRHRKLAFMAIEPSTAFHVPLSRLDQLAASDPTYFQKTTRVTGFLMDIAIATISDLLIPNAERRIAATMLRIASTRDPDPAEGYDISGLTQAQIGELANVARDVVNRTLKRFEAKGWIAVSYKRIKIVDPSALESLCS